MNEQIDINKVIEHPEKYIEINILKDNRMFETFHIYADETTFKHKKYTYDIDSDFIYLFPKAKGFIPTIFYKNKNKTPISLKNFNKGIPSRALTLLWNVRLYTPLVLLEDKKLNWFIIIAVLIQCAVLTAGLYLTYVHTGPIIGG